MQSMRRGAFGGERARFGLRAASVLVISVGGCQQERVFAEKSDAAGVEELSDPPRESEPVGERRLRTVYVPVYSHLKEHRDRKQSLWTLLSVRNIDSEAVVTLTHVDYFDTSGHRVRRYLDRPRRLGPLETAEFHVERRDDVGGSGANFLIYWEGPSDAHPLLTESVMWGHVGGGYISFASRGIELRRRPDASLFAKPSPGSKIVVDAGPLKDAAP